MESLGGANPLYLVFDNVNTYIEKVMRINT